MSIQLTDIKNIATIIKTKYGNNLFNMNFVFCFKKDTNSYFIFQEIQGMPIKRVVYHESNNSVSFVASWASWSNPFALVADANYDQIESWKDLQDRSRPFNSHIEITGGFNVDEWASVNRENKNEKKKRHKDKSDTFVEFRIDKVERAVFNENNFELYSPTISMIGFNRRYNFPYNNNFEDDGRDYPDPQFSSLPIFLGPNSSNSSNASYNHNETIRVSWQGRSFHIPEFNINSEEIVSVSNGEIPGGGQCDLSSYWIAHEENGEDELFDEELGNYFLDEKEDDDSILDVGQRDINLLFEE